MSINKAILLGNVGKDPEIRDTQSGKFATFSLATTDRSYTKKDGTVVPERTEWHNIVVYGPLVSVIERYVHKGTQLFIEGKIRTRKYLDRNNVEKYITEIMVDNLELLNRAETKNESVNPQFMNQEQVQNSHPVAPAPVEYNDLPWEK